jgi:lipid-A-disaccharide synthase
VTSLLVVAGEASGDRAAAAVVGRLNGVQAFGLGGPALAEQGVELVSDLRSSTALGVGETAVRAWHVLRAWRAVLQASRRRRPCAALLVNYSEFNTHVARRLHAMDVRVVWYGAPQVWAWRPRRVTTLGPFVDRMAVVLPFEERIWREAGVDARYVGHPALEANALDRESARRALAMTPYAAAIAVLPGSRPHEARQLLEPMLEAYDRVRSDRASIDARVLIAPSLDDSTRRWVRRRASERRVPTFDVSPQAGASRVLRAFDAALCASGTASLEATLARAVPIVAYRVGLTTEIAARLWVRTANVALPNVVLGRRVFAELLQREARARDMADAVADALDRRPGFVAACDEVEAVLGTQHTPSIAVAEMLAPWLGKSSHAG